MKASLWRIIAAAAMIALMAVSPARFIPMVAPVNIRLGPEGEILAWLASGPFPNVGALQLHGTGFATDYLGGEADAAPVEGVLIPMIPFEQSADPAQIVPRKPGWQLAIGTPTRGVDLNALLNGAKPAVAYLHTTLVSPDERDVQIMFGSDDGAKLYVNGQLLFQKQIARRIKRDEDRVPVHLHAGPNRFLFKIEHGDGPWGLLARVADSNGKGETNLTEHLDLHLAAPGSAGPAEPWVRQSAGKPGSLDLAAAVRYEELSARASRWLPRFRSEARDPEALESALRQSTEKLTQAADPSSLSRDLETAAKEIQQAYDHARAPLFDATQKALPQFQTKVAAEDYLSVMPGGRYFAHTDGTPFIPIGYNHNPDWPEFEEANPDGRVYQPEETARYMGHLKEMGVNTLRLMIETPPSGNLEDPIGTFSPEHVRWIDTIVAAARNNDIKLILTPWDTFWMNLSFETTPYNPELGGSLNHKIDFITSPVLRDQEKRRLKYLIDRWGNSGTIFSWELLNEADLWWGETPEQLHDWITDIAAYVRTYEAGKWGRNHMVSVSIADPMPKGELAVDAFDLPCLDYATTHLYIGASRAPTEPIGPALAIHEGVTYCLAQLKDQRPYMDTENGPIDRWIADETLDDQVFRNMIWAHLASGAAGSGFRWPYRHPHHLTEGMLASLKSMSTFAKEVPWKALAGTRVPLDAQGDPAAATCAFATAKAAILYTTGSQKITLTWPAGPKRITVRLFDPQTAHWLPPITVTQTASSLQLTLPTPTPTAALLTLANP